MEANFTVRNCNVPCCTGQHFIKFRNGKAVIPAWELFEIERHWRKNIGKIFAHVCYNDNLCKIHKKLECFLFFSNYIRERNINRNDVVSKIHVKENCEHPFCMN